MTCAEKASALPWVNPGEHKHTPQCTGAERGGLLDAARELATVFEAVGAGCDADNRFPTETVAPYKDSGLVGMAVPRRYGGLGADIWTTSLVGRELAKGDAGIALSYNMHQAMVGILRATPALDEPARERLMRRVAAENAIMCGTFSEARAGLAGLADTIAIPDPRGGWRLRGRKNWSTLIEGCDIVTLNATISDADGNVPTDFREHTAAEALFIFDLDTAGVVIERTWNTLGMRATGSQTLFLDDAYVPAESFGGNFRTGLVGEAEWAAILFGGVYLGLAERAYAECVDILRRKHTGATAAGADTEVRAQGHVQHAVGKMKADLEIAARTLESTAYLALKNRPTPELMPVRKAAFDLAKVAVTETAMSVTDTACRLVGGTAFARGHILERCFRDARGGVLHSFSTDQLYLMYGRSELGLLG
ncbi:MAG: acyl-CoA dehydrogenase family protein [Sporichthyaceae bacterium]